MKKYLTTLLTVVMALVVTTAYAQLDPRVDYGTCGFTSTEETWEPDSSGTLVKRVTYVSECDTPVAGDETITITIEEWNGATLETTEVREAVRTMAGGVFFTTTEIFDGAMALIGKEDHTYDRYETDINIWFQDWTYYSWNGVGFDLYAYTTKTVEQLGGEEMDVTHVFYDTTFRADPVIPDDVPVLGSSAASPILPDPHKDGVFIAKNDLGRMYDRVRNTLLVNANTQQEGNEMLRNSGLPAVHGLVPPNVYVASVLKGDRWDDPGFYSGFFHRWVSFANDVSGNLTVLSGWTSDRDLNEPTDDWWQARVLQSSTGAIENIENAHRSGLAEEDHYDTYTLLNSMFMIDQQTVMVFDWDELNPGNFMQTTTVTNAMAAPVSFAEWTVIFN